MGKETRCTAHFEKQSSAGTLQHESDELRFRGDFRLKIPLKQITKALAKNGELRVQWPEGEARFELGEVAVKWADAINNPKSLLDKLGVKPDHIVSVIGIDDEGFLADLNRRVPNLTSGKPARDSDLVFFQADQPKQLEQLKKLAKTIQPTGAVWVITPKKRAEIADTVVITAGKAAGLVDVKVARFSDSHTALKFVIPVGRR